MNLFFRAIRSLKNRISGPRYPHPFILLDETYRRIGIGNYENADASGEEFFIDTVLPRLMPVKNPTIFDVGANKGDYAKSLLRRFPEGNIHCFEPSPHSYAALCAELGDSPVKCIQQALGENEGRAGLFDYADHLGSQHASLHANVLRQLHGAATPIQTEVVITTIDAYCAKNNVLKIDFLKLDTEGHELPALRGAAHMIAEQRVPLIQFEFNEMNVVSRAFLKDFYDILMGFRFYRLMPRGLLPLEDYNARNEIFQFQNIVAMHSTAHPHHPDFDVSIR